MRVCFQAWHYNPQWPLMSEVSVWSLPSQSYHINCTFVTLRPPPLSIYPPHPAVLTGNLPVLTGIWQKETCINMPHYCLCLPASIHHVPMKAVRWALSCCKAGTVSGTVLTLPCWLVGPANDSAWDTPRTDYLVRANLAWLISSPLMTKQTVDVSCLESNWNHFTTPEYCRPCIFFVLTSFTHLIFPYFKSL